MKAISLLTAMFLASATLFAQEVAEGQVPSVVINTFNKEFPKASDVEWERQGDNYEVEFEVGFFTDHEAWFSASGELLRHAEEISKRSLPDVVVNAVKRDFSGYRIDDVEKINEKNTVTYYVELEKENEERHLMFSKDGDIIKNL